jgi:Subtilase family
MHWQRSRVLLAAAAAWCLAAVMAAQPTASAQQMPAPGAQPEQTMIVVLSARCAGPGTSVSGTGDGCPAQAPVLAQLQAAGATVLSTTTLVDTITARMSEAEVTAVSRSPGVAQVVPDSPVPVVTPSAQSGPFPNASNLPGASGWRSHAPVQSSAICGTERHPELDPQALQAIHATEAEALGFDGAGVTVAFLADGIDPTNPDLQRNPAYGKPGAPVITEYQDFSGAGTSAPTPGGEAFLDASSIAAQGNTAYNVAQYVAPGQAARLPASGCWIRIVGAAPGADLMALSIFSKNGYPTNSGVIQAIQYAVDSGAKVINESFGSNPFPDTSLDLIRAADDAAVAAGVTVVTSSGDAGVTSTIGSPATDPNLISVGASTTFRGYAQDNQGGFYNPSVGNGRWANNNISSLSSSGFTQAGNTVDLVAPGDLNWALCSPDVAMYSDCTNETGGPSDVLLTGGTSEASPLTAAAAADVIQAYADAHGGADPSPALVKQILLSTATDIDAPASEQGAGLLNVLAAVKLAASLPAPGGASQPAPAVDGAGPGQPGVAGSGLLIGPNQINIQAPPGTPESEQISVTNAGGRPARVQLSTRALTGRVYDSGAKTFTLDPSNPTTNTGTFEAWNGFTYVYQTERFLVPSTKAGAPSRLQFSADYQFTGQTSVLHVALFEPDGTYAGYSLPQGLSDYAAAEVADPPPGLWTAVFFTEQNGASPGAIGTSGPVQWDASTWAYAPAGTIRPSSLDIAPGGTATATLDLTTPSSPGDTDQSIVVSSGGDQNTVPVTVRTVVPIGPDGGTFSGVLAGGNGRPGAPAQTNTYYFAVPPGQTDLDASVALATDPGNELIAYLVNPNGQTVGYSSNYTLLPTSTGLQPGATRYMQIYHVAPEAGQWALVLAWQNPVTGNELAEPFTGAIEFNQVSVSSNLPSSPSSTLPPLTATAYDVNVDNTGVAPEAFFVDARLDQDATITLANQNPAVTATSFTVPIAFPTTTLTFPYYFVPTHTTALTATVSSLDGTTPVTFDTSYLPGDPDVSPDQPAPGVTGSTSAGSASLTLTEPTGVSPGVWNIVPDEVGPYPPGGAPTVTVSTSLTALTQAFDPTVTASTDDLWLASGNASAPFGNLLYLAPGQTGSITVDITPTGSVGSTQSGTLYVDDYTLASAFNSGVLPSADELAAIPYSYKVGGPSRSQGTAPKTSG